MNTIARMDDGLHIREGLVIPHWELIFTASRSGGPGGQHANKTNSRVTLHWSLDASSALSDFDKRRLRQSLSNRINAEGVIQLHVEDTRQQSRNKELAAERLATLIREGLKTQKRRRPTKRTKSSQRRRIAEKRARGDVKKMRKAPVKSDD